jgi:hypothetical protein
MSEREAALVALEAARRKKEKDDTGKALASGDVQVISLNPKP